MEFEYRDLIEKIFAKDRMSCQINPAALAVCKYHNGGFEEGVIAAFVDWILSEACGVARAGIREYLVSLFTVHLTTILPSEATYDSLRLSIKLGAVPEARDLSQLFDESLSLQGEISSAELSEEVVQASETLYQRFLEEGLQKVLQEKGEELIAAYLKRLQDLRST